MSAPCRVPIEIRAAGGTTPRVFHLAHAIAPRRVELGTPLPADVDWLNGDLVVRFHLPGGAAAGAAIECHARARELVFDEGTENEHAALAALELEGLAPEAAQRIEAYVEERLLQA